MLRLLSLAALAALLAAGPATAEPIQFDYFGSIRISGNVEGVPPGTGYATSPLDDGFPVEATPGVPLALDGLAIYRFGPAPEGAVHFDHEVTYGVGLTMDLGRGGMGELVGRLAGTLDGLTGSTLRLEFPDEPLEVRVGGYLFRVRVGSVDIPSWGDPAGEVVGIPVEVTVNPATLTQVPEPASLALAVAGFGLLGLARRRRPTAASV